MLSGMTPRSNQGDPKRDDVNRVIVFAPDAQTAGWIQHELDGQPVEVQLGGTLEEVIRALVEAPPPRAQILIADFDAMTPADVLRIHALREQGWFGSIVALGEVSDDLRKSLAVDTVLGRPFSRNQLPNAVTAVGLHRATTKMKKLER